MNTEKDNNFNIDLADYHGLSTERNENPYSPPKSAEDPFAVRDYVKLGFWSYLALVFLLLWYGFWTYINIAAGLARNGVNSIDISVLVLTVSLFLVHLLVVFKVEIARKLAVAHAFILLLGIPVGTVIGLILLKSLKGKSFRRNRGE